MQIQGNQISFSKANKPMTVSLTQREVRSFYSMLCKPDAKGNPCPRLLGEARAELSMFIGKYSDTSPTTLHALESAARAYVGMGASLANRKMFSMDLVVPMKDIEQYGLPNDVLEQIKQLGVAEVIFKAREI